MMIRSRQLQTEKRFNSTLGFDDDHFESLTRDKKNIIVNKNPVCFTPFFSSHNTQMFFFLK